MKFIKSVPFIMFLLITGCDDNNSVSTCDELGSFPTEFDITGADIGVLVARDLREDPLIGDIDIYSENSEVEYDDIVFRIDFETQFIAFKKQKAKDIPFSFISSAHACSSVPPTTNEKLVDIKVSSSSAFNNELATGDSLKAKFNVYSDNETAFYGDENDTKLHYSLNQYLEQADISEAYTIYLKLSEEPEFMGSHVFFIEITLDTGEIFTLQTPQINFTKS